jgi:hypothetical protein
MHYAFATKPNLDTRWSFGYVRRTSSCPITLSQHSPEIAMAQTDPVAGAGGTTLPTKRSTDGVPLR